MFEVDVEQSEDSLAVDSDRLADVQRMLAGGAAAAPTKVTPAMLDGLTHQQLRELREMIDRKLPDNSLDELNLEKELVSQYMLVKRLQDAVITDDTIAPNQRAQVANAVAATLQQLAKLQDDLRRQETFKLMESVLVDTLKEVSEEVRTAFYAEYEAQARRAGFAID